MTSWPDRPRPGGRAAATEVAAHAHSLGAQYLATGSRALLDQGISLAEQAVATCADDGSRVDLDFVLGALFGQRAALTGNETDLDAAIDHTTRAVSSGLAQTPLDTAPAARVLSLGHLLRIRFEQRGRLADLDEAIRLLSHIPDDNQGTQFRAMRRNRLGLALKRRFEYNNDLPDLLLAIQVLTEAVDSAEDLEGILASVLNNLGSAYQSLFWRTASPDALNEAVERHRTSVRLSAPGSSMRPTRLSNLAQALTSRYELRHDLTDLQKAVEVAAAAVQVTSLHDVERPRRLNTYATILTTRYEANRNPPDLQIALKLGEATLKACQPEQAHRAEYLNALANRLLYAHTQTRDSGLFNRALRLYDEARGLETSLIHDRGKAAVRWAVLTSSVDLGKAIEGARAAFDLLAAIDWHGMQIADRLSTLRNWSGFASLAASWAIELGRHADAMRLLEQGRGQLWAQITDTRPLLIEGPPSALKLVTRLSTIHAELNALTANNTASVEDARPSHSTRRGTDLRRLNAERRRLISELRNIPGMEDFLAAPSLRRLQPALSGGPVILVNLSSRRCDALLLRNTGEETAIEALGLPTIRIEEVEGKVRAFGVAISTARSARRELLDDRHTRRQSRRQAKAAFGSALDEIQDLLIWGWESITGPVLDTLGYLARPTGTKPWPQVWWSPTGPLTMFPLHATGYHDGSDNAVIDRVISSETATLRALANASIRPRRTHPARLLVVAVPRPGHQAESLAAVPEEIWRRGPRAGPADATRRPGRHQARDPRATPSAFLVSFRRARHNESDRPQRRGTIRRGRANHAGRSCHRSAK